MPTFEVVDKPEVARLVRFSTGHLNPQAKDEIEFKCFGDKSNERKSIVTTNVNGIEYCGQNFGQSNTVSTENCDYYVAVQRKGADKIQILPAKLFNLNPKIEEKKGLSVSDDDSDEEKKEETKEILIEKSRTLTAQFGSGRSLKKMRRAIDQKMDDEALNLISQSVQSTPKIPSDPSTPGTSSGDPNVVKSVVVPPHNADATNPGDVYLLETIIPDSVMKDLREQSEVFVKCTSEDIAKWRKEKTKPTFVLNLLERLPLNYTDRESKCTLIMYLNCLMHVYNLKGRINKDRYPSDWKGLVNKLLDDNFTLCSFDASNKSRRRQPAYLRDLLLSHILILSMRLCDYSIELKPFVGDLKLALNRLVLHANTLGFKVSGSTDKVAKLTVPFSLPPPPLKRKRK